MVSIGLKGVASRAGVSATTVSRILRGQPGASAETRDSILRIAAELGYVPDLAARRMRTGSAAIVGLVTDVVATTPYSVDIIRGVQSEVESQGRHLLIGNSNDDPAVAADYWRMFREHGVTEIVYATVYHHEVTDTLPGGNFRFVLVNCYSDKERLPTVLADEREGGRLQAAHLADLGHRNIAVLTFDSALMVTSLRLDGVRSELKSRGIELPKERVIEAISGSDSFQQDHAFESAVQLLRGEDRPTAIICANDQMAMQVFGAAAEVGLRIPRDLSVIGFDDFKMISAKLHPGLTTIDLPYFEMGREAVRRLLKGGSTGPSHSTTIPTRLVERQSCAPPRAA